MSRDAIKKAVGYKAAEFVKEGMRVGLGTGTTAFYFIERLIQKCREGLHIQAVATSKRSFQQASEGGISMLDIDTITSLDLTVDGADEIDEQKRMIKGGGGALVRERIVASMSRELIIIVDESKVVSSLGKVKLPVEVIPFGQKATAHLIQKAGYHGEFRRLKNGNLFISDNGNWIFDIHFSKPLSEPEKDYETLLHLPGVVDIGFFFHLASRVIIGFSDGQVIVKS